MQKYPLTPITGAGLGISYSSQVIESIYSLGGLGQAKVCCYPNLFSGNLVCEEPGVTVIEETGPLRFNFTYNSQAPAPAAAWHFSLNQQLIVLPKSPGQPLVLLEADGHQTTFKWDEAHQRYEAPTLRSGRSFIIWDAAVSSWVLHYPITNAREYYNGEGYLKRRVDCHDRNLNFFYDEKMSLIAIEGPTGNRYEFKHGDKELDIIAIEEGQPIPLRQYLFDQLGRLIKIITPNDQYWVAFVYDNPQGYLSAITQTDGTQLTLMYSADSRIHSIKTGAGLDSVSLYSITYANDSHPIASIKDGSSNETSLVIDQQGRLTKWLAPTGFSNSKIRQSNISQYSYDDQSGQLRKVIHVDDSETLYEYDDQSYGLLKRVTAPNGLMTEWIYLQHGNRCLPVCQLESTSAQSKLLVKRRVYQRDDKAKFEFLRFEVSPEGRITEYQPDKNGNIASKREYLSHHFPVEKLKPQAIISLVEMEEWVTSVKAQWTDIPETDRLCLEEYIHDPRGQTQQITNFTRVDKEGVGIKDESTGVRQVFRDKYGQWYQKATLQRSKAGKEVLAISYQHYDDLGRVTSHIDALGAITQTEHHDDKNQTKVTYPNNRVEINSRNAAGYSTEFEASVNVSNIIQTTAVPIEGTTPCSAGAIEVIEKASSQTFPSCSSSSQIFSNRLSAETAAQIRKTVFQNDTGGRPVVTRLLDGRATITFFDGLNRPGYIVDTTGLGEEATGFVKAHMYDDKHRNLSTKLYANPVKVKDLYLLFKPDLYLPNLDRLLSALEAAKDVENDREQWQFFDNMGNECYHVTLEHLSEEESRNLGIRTDSNSLVESRFVVETRYDEWQHKVTTIAYRDSLSDEQWQALKSGQPITLQPNVQYDQCHRYFYDKDGLLIGEQDAGGFVIAYLHDAGGRVIRTHRFATPHIIDLEVTDFIYVCPTDSALDVITYSFWNGRNQLSLVIDGDGYLTQHEYWANDLRRKTRVFAEQISETWLANPFGRPPLPLGSDHDQCTSYKYDLLNRPLSVQSPLRAIKSTQYDKMGQVAGEVTQDADAKDVLDGDRRRSQYFHYDGWEQKIAEANPFVAAKLDKINADKELSPEQKAEACASVWQHYSSQLLYDDSGLLLKQIIPYSNDNLSLPILAATLFYYDQHHRLKITINARGGVKEIQRNSFGEVIETRQYMKNLSAKQMQNLSGGIITTAVEDLIATLKDDANDQIKQNRINQRGLVVEVIDPEQNHFQYKFNAFKQCILEKQPINMAEPTLVIRREFDPRGLQTKEVKQAAEQLDIIKIWRYENLFGLESLYIDAGKGEHKTTYNKRGLEATKSNPLTFVTDTYHYDAFSRVAEHLDALGYKTKTIYNDNTRTKITYYEEEKTLDIEEINVFGQRISSTNALSQSKQWTHAPDGQIVEERIDSLERISIYEYNTLGWCIGHRAPDGVLTRTHYDALGGITEITENAPTIGQTRILATSPLVDINPPQANSTPYYDLPLSYCPLVPALPTKADGQCFFHAVFGKSQEGVYSADNPQVLRKEWHDFLNRFHSLADGTMPEELRVMLQPVLADLYQHPEHFPPNLEQVEKINNLREQVRKKITKAARKSDLLINNMFHALVNGLASEQLGMVLVQNMLLCSSESEKRQFLYADLSCLANQYAPEFAQWEDSQWHLFYRSKQKEIFELWQHRHALVITRLRDDLKFYAHLFDEITYSPEHFDQQLNPEIIILQFLNDGEVFAAYLSAIIQPDYYVHTEEIRLLASLSNKMIRLCWHEAQGYDDFIDYLPDPTVHALYSSNCDIQQLPMAHDQSSVVIYHDGFQSNGQTAGYHFSRAHPDYIAKLQKEKSLQQRDAANKETTSVGSAAKRAPTERVVSYPVETTKLAQESSLQVFPPLSSLPDISLMSLSDHNELPRGTTYERDMANNITLEKDARSITTIKKYDRLNHLTEIQLDPSVEGYVGLDRLHQTRYFSNGTIKRIIEGDKSTPNQYEESFSIDGFGRTIQQVIDPVTDTNPTGLAIATHEIQDLMGRTIAKCDPDGHVTRWFFDKAGQKRVRVDAEGGVREWRFDKNGRVVCRIDFALTVDIDQLTNQTTLEEALAKLKATDQDSKLYYFYDKNGRERYCVTGLGKIYAKNYDLASRLIEKIQYSILLDPATIGQQTTSTIESYLSTHPDAQARHTYYILDAADQVRFIIEDQAITEQRFDSKGRTIEKIHYATLASDPAHIAQLPVNEVFPYLLSHHMLSFAEDRIEYTVYTPFDKPWFEVTTIDCTDSNLLARVTRSDYDSNNNLTQSTAFAKPFTIPSDYTALVGALKKLIPDPTIDTITCKFYNAANELERQKDALGYTDKFERNALGEISAHTDRASKVWRQTCDRAKRVTDHIAPETSWVQINISSTNPPKLEASSSSAPLITHQEYNSSGDVVKIIEGFGLPDARVLQMLYNGRKQLVATIQENVAIDNGANPTNFQSRPETPITITISTVYDANGLPVVNINEKGARIFHIYDPDRREIYQVDDTGRVIEYQRNAFDEIVKEIHYAKTITLAWGLYELTGIPPAVVQKAIEPEPADDHFIIHTYDKQGQLTRIEQGPPIFYYEPTNRTSPLNTAIPTIKQTWNRFKELVKKETWVDAAEDVWATEYYWYDQGGRQVAEAKDITWPVDGPAYAIIWQQWNVFNKAEEKHEFVTPLKRNVSSLSLKDLDQELTTLISSYDPVTRNVYDVRGDVIEAIEINVVTQSVVPDSQNELRLVDLSPKDLSRHYIYTPTQKLWGTQNERGDWSYKFYDARDILIAETAIPRLSEQNGQMVIPLTTYGIDAFGKTALTVRYALGATKVEAPIPVAPSTDDQYELKLFDMRGLPIYLQDANGVVKQATYTQTKKPALLYWPLTTYSLPPNYTPFVNLDSERMEYDALDRPVRQVLLRNGQTVQSTQTVYDVFNNVIAEGEGNGSLSVFRYFDSLNREWLGNAKNGVYQLTLRGLAGPHVNLEAVSATRKLSHYNTPDQIPSILQWQNIDLEKTINCRDFGGRVCEQHLPSLDTPPANVPTIPITVRVSQRAPAPTGREPTIRLSWANPQALNVKQVLKVRPLGTSNDDWQLLPIQIVEGLYDVDVTDLSSDHYEYTIDYYFKSLKDDSEGALTYRTQGEFQVMTNTNKNSHHVVGEVIDDSWLWLDGKIESLSEIELWQNGHQIGTKGVIIDESTKQRKVNLQEYSSGSYTFYPIFGQEKSPNESLPFTIYTNKPASEPLARELLCNVSLSTLKAFGELNWQVPRAYMQHYVKLNCEYVADDGQIHTHEDIIAPTRERGRYKDKNGHILICNTVFDHSVIDIRWLSLSIQTSKDLDPSNDEWIPLYQQVTPLPTQTEEKLPLAIQEQKLLQSHCLQQEGQAHTLILDNEWVIIGDVNETIDNNVIQKVEFGTRLIAYVTPLLHQTEAPLVSYYDNSLGRYANWKQLQAIGITSQGIVLDVSGFTAGIYPAVLSKTDWTLQLSIGGAVYLSEGQSSKHSSATPMQKKRTLLPTSSDNPPTHAFTYTALGDVLTSMDSLNNVTQYTYNQRRQVRTRTLPAVDVVDEHGQVHHNVPTVYGIGYNECGVHIADSDGNNHVEADIVNAAGQSLARILGEGTVISRSKWDALGREVTTWNGQNLPTTQTYDHNNHIITVTSALPRRWLYNYNEKGMRCLEMDPAGNTQRYNYSIQGDVTQSFTPLGQWVEMTYDRNHQLLTILHADKTISSYTRDYFGREQSHTDRIHRTFNQEYDQKGQVIRQYEADAVPVDQWYARLEQQTMAIAGWFGKFLQGMQQFRVKVEPAQLLDLNFDYRVGQLIHVKDKTHFQDTYYSYDSENRRTGIEVWEQDPRWGTKSLVRSVHGQLDCQGRSILTYDDGAQLYIQYDGNSNRRSISIYYPGTSSQAWWWTYDAANRVTRKGGLQNGEIVLVPGGFDLIYSAGYRFQEKRYSEGVGTTLNYDAEGRLLTTLSSNASSSRRYALSGYREGYTATLPSGRQQETISCNNNGWLLSDVNNQASKHVDKSDITYPIDSFTAEGLPQRQIAIYMRDNRRRQAVRDELNINYAVAGDVWRQALVGGTRALRGHKPGRYSSAQMLYSATGNPVVRYGGEEPEFKQKKNKKQQGANTVVFQGTWDGLILNKTVLHSKGKAGLGIPGLFPTIEVAKYHYFYGLNNEPLGSVQSEVNNNRLQLGIGFIAHAINARGLGAELGLGNFATSRFNLADSVSLVSPAGSSRIASMSGWNRVIQRALEKATNSQMSSAQVVFPSAQESTCVVGSGDTFESLAQRQYGDASLAGLLAVYNHWPMEEKLTPGVTIHFPLLIPMHNRYGTSAAFDAFMAQIIGSLYPHLKMRQPHKKHSFWQTVVAVVVTVAVAIVAPYIAPVVAGALGISTAVALAASAALLNLAGQGLLIGLGIQSKVDWKSVIEAALTANVAGVKLNSWQALGQMIVSYGTTAVAAQLMEMSLGLRDHFDFNQVLLAITTAVTTSKINSQIEARFGENSWQTRALESAANSVDSAILGNVIAGTRIDISSLAANALGTFIAREGVAQARSYIEQKKTEALLHQLAELNDRNNTLARHPGQVLHVSDRVDSSQQQTPSAKEQLARLKRYQDSVSITRSQKQSAAHSQDKETSSTSSSHPKKQLPQGASAQRLEHTKLEDAHDYILGAEKQLKADILKGWRKLNTPTKVEDPFQMYKSYKNKSIKEVLKEDWQGIKNAVKYLEVDLPANWKYFMDADFSTKGALTIKALEEVGTFALKNYSGRGLGGIVGSIEKREFSLIKHKAPNGSVGSVHAWTTKARLKVAKLPSEGKIRFVPDKGYHPSEPIMRGPNNGYVDRFGNEWVKGPSRTPGQPFEWDVQLSSLGRKQLGWASRDGRHLNVSLNGRVTHK